MQDDEISDEECRKVMIQGRFIIAVKHSTETTCWIKLDEIKYIEIIKNEDMCYFNTYKDHKFTAFLSHIDLLNAINNVLLVEKNTNIDGKGKICPIKPQTA